MPANLSPEYRAAEERLRQARTVEEKIACLEEMLRVIPKHKGTEKLQADLKTRLSKFRKQPKKKGGAHISQHVVRREGAGQIALVGPPNSGKSSLVRALTHARPEVADYPFTTREEVPGMMAFEDIAFQLVDLPPLSAEHVDPWVHDIIRGADLLWIVVEATNSLDELQNVRSLLGEKRIDAYPATAGPGDRPSGPSPRPALLVVTRLDEPGGRGDIDILRELVEEPWPIYPVSTTEGTGLEALRRGSFEALDLIRVYTKQPGKPADRQSPFALKRGATVEDLARAIHKEVSEGLRFARIWGKGVYDGQTVQREHVLADGDIVEIHM